MKEDFETVYRRFGGGENTSEELKPLLEEVFNSLNNEPVNLASIKDSFISLFSFLCEPKNRTEDNCHTVDWFFTLNNHWDTSKKYPDQYKQLLDNIMCLHDTISAPEIAINFESTPEQLLAQAKELTI